MRGVDRKAFKIPASLQPGGLGPKELTRARDHRNDANPKKKTFTHSAYKGADVKAMLEAMFHGKCAYCETRFSASAPVDVEHYRPKGSVAEAEKHGGYWWVAMDWDNLLPSCIDCNRRRGQVLADASSSLEVLATAAEQATTLAGKQDSFPVVDEAGRVLEESVHFDDEGALLINPCLDDPSRSLTYNFDPARPLGLIVPNGEGTDAIRGAVSIQIYGLNRLRLVQDRTEILRRLEFLAGLVVDLAKSIADLEEPATVLLLEGTAAAMVAPRLRLLRDRTLAEMKGMTSDDAPYATMTKAWLEAFKDRLRGDDRQR
ncbi:hypothetical protein LPN01_18205 [Sphingomonas sp. A2-49]|uniref:hypothetical protein n=1 Tax=Sphingomonas sp. A2-49 TaxID=1391375 RepID=UPI0021D06F7A|nr:hypothetical protein [Sphingomonas sp. A2-49]MCU6456015.1 hypothetical protein [Sphingomonas sp. A2-49]